jgi:daunorubicin/doxorubicin transport system ATP-binding protein
MTQDSAKSSPSVPAVEVVELVKRFGDTSALDGLTLSVARGQIYGVLGPNGAGKTTMIRILATLLRPDVGTARVLGHDVVRDADAVRSRISLTGQFAALDKDLTGSENLTLLARLRGLGRAGARRRAAELLEAFALTEAATRQVKTYSGGMRRRLDLAASFITTPDLLFLDEPTTGLDPRSRNEVWDAVRAATASGTTVLLTTQYLEEADQLADRIAVIDGGKLLAEGTPGELKASIASGRLELRLRDPAQRSAAMALITRVVSGTIARGSDPAGLSTSIDRLDVLPEVLGTLRRAGIELAALSVGQPSLDEVFLALTGRPVEREPVVEEAA